MDNTLKSAERLWEQSRAIKVTRLQLDIKEKVPSDIEIASAQTPKNITTLAREIGLLQTEVENYGKYKAKVELSVLDRLNHRKDGKYIVISGFVSLSSTACHVADECIQHHPNPSR
jgi:methylenetetrahydrofolate dehydrogenase (NADP+)/methenyltetrahydrofolate cyclohydrolase/formyltetrahydrofolate synthetase